MLTDFLATSSFTSDLTHFHCHVQQMFLNWRRKLPRPIGLPAHLRRYCLMRKVLRRGSSPARFFGPEIARMGSTASELLAVCEEAAQAGAKELLAWWGRFQARQKAPRDLVTDADLASEKAVRAVIAAHFPDHGILGEEAPVLAQLRLPYCWVVDPLDGTTNYAHGLPCYAVSVAVAHEGRLLAGVVYDPERQENFAAAAGLGARLNGKPMAVSQAMTLEEGLFAVSFPAQLVDDSPDLIAFLRVAPRCQAIRRTGSAALNLAYVACGRLDGHWAHDIHPWDSAAGVLLIQEAGGVATSSNGRQYELAAGDYLTAATQPLYDALRPLVAVDKP
jgi:myo-inositol-1(or 4)-monophosphatase